MDVRNIAWCDDGLRINCEINHPTYGWIEFTAAPDGDTREIYAAAMRGDYGPVAPAPPPPEPTREEVIADVRLRLREDYRQAPPASLEDRITALEILVGLKDPEIDDKEKTRG